MENLKNKNFLFIFGHGGMEVLTLKIARELEKKWKTKSYFSGGSQGGDQFLIKKGIPSQNIHTVVYSDSIKKYPKPNIEFIKRSEEKYGFNCWDIWQISAPRIKKRLKFTPNKVLYWMEYYIRETEACLKRFNPDYVIFYGIASFSGVILYKMLLHYKIGVLEIVNSRIPNRFTINDNLENKWPLLVKQYNKLQQRDLSPEEKEKAEDFIASFQEKFFKPDGVGNRKTPLKKTLAKYIYYIKLYSMYRKQLPNLKQFIWPFTKKLLDWSGTFELPVKGEKYVYFPLHVNPEVSTSYYGKWYVNQLELIENISRSIPADYMLYVKEHPFSYFSRPLYFHKQIKKFPNVRLISPHANSMELTKKSSLILTITGTTGWEAILLQKPVITFGDVYYNLFDEVIKVRDIRKLPFLIKNKLDSKTDKDKTLKFVTSVFNSTFSGRGVMPDNCVESLKKENISLIVEGIEKYINLIKN